MQKIEQNNISTSEYVCLVETIVQMLLMVHLWVVNWSRSFCTVRVVKSLWGQWTLNVHRCVFFFENSESETG